MKKLDGKPLKDILHIAFTQEVIAYQQKHYKRSQIDIAAAEVSMEAMLKKRFAIASTVSRFSDPRQERCVTVDQADEVYDMIDTFSVNPLYLEAEDSGTAVLQKDQRLLRANSIITVINTTEPVHCNECSRSGSCPEEARRLKNQK